MNISRPQLLQHFYPLSRSVISGCLLIAAALSGCDDGTKTGSSGSASMEARISGNIKDQHGPIVNSRLEVADKSGRVVSSQELTGADHYSIAVPAGTSYPIVLTAHPTGASATNSTPVKAVVTSPLADRMDITDVSTIVVDSALALGGLTAENIAKASGAAIGLRQREGVSAGAGGGGSGPGQSGGGVSRGGHGGHGTAESGSGGSTSGGMGQGHDMPSGSH